MPPSFYSQQTIDLTSCPKLYVFCLGALIVVYITKVIVKTLVSPLRNIPGPFITRFTRLWEIYASWKYDYPTHNIELHRKYGPIVRLAPNRYSINDAEAARTILGLHNAMDKSGFYYPFGQPETYNLFSEPSNAAHAIAKRPQAQLYSTTNLLSYEPFVDNCNTILLRRFEEYVREGKKLDVRELMQYYAFDVIGEITVGSRFGLMEANGDASGIIDTIHSSLIYSSTIGFVPEVHWWVGKICNTFRLPSPFKTIQEFVDVRLQDRISGRTKSPDDRQDFLDKLLPLEQAGKATRIHTKMACQSNVAAGSDTTAIALASIIAFLTMHPPTMASLRKELEDAKGRGDLSDPVQYKEAHKLPYLQAVIYEAMRVHPAVGLPLTRVVGKDGARVAGRYFPPGTEVGVNAWVLHKNQDVYGPDADVFRPERWLTKDPAHRSAMDRNFLSFGMGPRTCIGKNISLLEMCKVIPQIVMKYDFEMVTDEQTGKDFTWETRWFAKPSFKCFVKRKMID